MAFSAAANATQRVGNYAPGSLAAQPRRFAGGVRKRGESPDQMANRMDAGYMASAMQGGTTAPTRADNIAKARADGTFDAKRDAFNAANKGSFMDSQGNIGPKAPPLPGSTTPAPASAPAAPSSAPAPTPAPVAPAKPKGPATFDGKSKTDFFGAAMSKYGPTAGVSTYKDTQVQAVAANNGKPLPAPKPSPAPAAKPADMVAAATPAKPYSGPMARPPGQVDAKPAAPTVTPAPKPAGIVADENNNEVFIGDKGSNELKEVSPGNFDVVPKQMPGAPPPGTVHRYTPGPIVPVKKKPAGFVAATSM